MQRDTLFVAPLSASVNACTGNGPCKCRAHTAHVLDMLCTDTAGLPRCVCQQTNTFNRTTMHKLQRDRARRIGRERIMDSAQREDLDQQPASQSSTKCGACRQTTFSCYACLWGLSTVRLPPRQPPPAVARTATFRSPQPARRGYARWLQCAKSACATWDVL
jgi:hypothetical protein